MSVSEQTWWEWMLFPVGVRSSIFERDDDGAVYPHVTQLWVCLPVAILISFVRIYVVEGFLATTIAAACGMKRKQKTAPPAHPQLLAAFAKSPKKVPAHVLEKHAAELGADYIERWWRKQRVFAAPTKFTKFQESFWRFTFYSSMLVYGVWALWDKAWFWDTELYWIKNPLHHLPPSIRWYYVIELSFYLALLASQFTDVRRKDFVEMFVHHVVTILLMVFSWSANMIRIGSLVLIAHDFADIFLDLAKMVHYAGNDSLANTLFPVFAVAFFVSRLVLYPSRVVWSSMVEVEDFLQDWPSGYYFNGLMIVLQILHVFWFATIMKMAFAFLKTSGNLKKDFRSSDEEEDEAPPPVATRAKGE